MNITRISPGDIFPPFFDYLLHIVRQLGVEREPFTCYRMIEMPVILHAAPDAAVS